MDKIEEELLHTKLEKNDELTDLVKQAFCEHKKIKKEGRSSKEPVESACGAWVYDV